MRRRELLWSLALVPLAFVPSLAEAKATPVQTKDGPVCFYRGQHLGRGHLRIFLTGPDGTRSDPAEITFEFFDFTTGEEVAIGLPKRVPVNPAVGEYFAKQVIPLDTNLGSYRIRWTFREASDGPPQQVVQEFEVL